MQWLLQRYKIGIIFCMIFGVFALIVAWVASLIDQISIPFSGYSSLNLFLNAAIFLVALPILVGAVLSGRLISKCLLGIFSVFPKRFRKIAEFFLTHDFDKISLLGLPEVMYWTGGNGWTLGLVVKELNLPANPLDPVGSLEKWFYIAGPYTPPLLITGMRLDLYPASKVVYTGRTSDIAILTTASFGTKLKLDPQQFKVVE